jgi:hypothetical protein
MKYQKIPTYKYRLLEDEKTVLSHAFGDYDINVDFMTLSAGVLILKKGYAWDGASGPAFDTKTIMRGSLVHDALCQLIWLGELPESRQIDADKELRKICLEDGMSKLRAWWVYTAVRLYARFKRNPAEPRVFET